MSDETKDEYDYRWSHPWLTTWEDDGPEGVRDAELCKSIFECDARFLNDAQRYACILLAAAAPELARALCLVEWEGVDQYAGDALACPSCYAPANPGLTYEPVHGPHRDGCDLDAGLTKAGLDAEAREAVRRGSK